MADANDNVRIRISTSGGAATRRDLEGTSRSLRGVGNEAQRSGRSLRAFGGASMGLGRGLTALGHGAAYTAAALGGMALVLGKKSYDAYTETYKVGRATNQVIRSTGGLANVSAGQVGNLATALSRKSGVDDEAIQSGENMLLTFRNIRNEAGAGNDIFNQSTRTLVDLATVMHRSPEKAAIMLGKALNDPAKGMTALTRVGVTFDAGQQKRIKWLTAHNRTLEAQRIILRELNTEFGGQAAARATPTEKLAVAWGNVEEAIGKVEHRFLDRLAPPMTRFLTRLEPRITRFGTSLDRIFGRQDLDLAQKLRLTGVEARTIFAPLVTQGRRSLRDAHFGPALGHAVDVAAPIIASHMASASGQAARAFARAWWHTDVWGKLFTAGVFLSRTGLLSSLLGACGPLSKVFATCATGGNPGQSLLSKGLNLAKKAVPFGAGAAAGDAGLALGAGAVALSPLALWAYLSRDPKNKPPVSDVKAYRTSKPALGAYSGRHVDAQGFQITDAQWRRQHPVNRGAMNAATVNAAAAPIIVHNYTTLTVDGKEIARAVTRQAHKKAALK